MATRGFWNGIITGGLLGIVVGAFVFSKRGSMVFSLPERTREMAQDAK
ncbi:MAG: hypothetical protein H5U02_09035 [Clostridia bacterium]|nr:hypothetical protein [Clostridia bacterium]